MVTAQSGSRPVFAAIIIDRDHMTLYYTLTITVASAMALCLVLARDWFI